MPGPDGNAFFRRHLRDRFRKRQCDPAMQGSFRVRYGQRREDRPVRTGFPILPQEPAVATDDPYPERGLSLIN